MFDRITTHWPAWLAVTVSYPIAGVAGHALAGPATTWSTALVAGAIAGLVVGGAQAVAMSLRRPDVRWVLATAIGSAVGLSTSVALGLEPLPTGAVTGVLIGIGQASTIPGEHRGAATVVGWPLIVAIAWAAAWSVTTVIGVDRAAGWAVFGLSGALTSQILTLTGALVLERRALAVAA